jgi:hypothetical protein
MGTEVATRSRTELAQDTAFDPFAVAGNEMGGSSALYAKFNGNSGEMTYGSQAEEVAIGEKMAADVYGARKGWICWVESEVAEEIMVPIVQGQPPRSDQLADHGPYKKYDDGTQDGWSEQFAINFRLLGEDHDGAEITYKTSTKSAMRPLGDLIKQFSREYKANPGCVPIVEFGRGDYMPKEKKHGKKFFPTFKIVDWILEDELQATYGEGNKVEEGDDNDNLIEAPAAKAVAAPKKDKPAAAAKAAAKKVEKAAAPAVVEAPAVEEDDEEAALLAQLAASRAKKAAAAQAAAEAEAAAGVEDNDDGSDGSAEDVPAEVVEKPAGAARARRRNF